MEGTFYNTGYLELYHYGIKHLSLCKKQGSFLLLKIDWGGDKWRNTNSGTMALKA